MTYLNLKEICKILKSRLKSQRRVFTFDEDQIIVIPSLEHVDIDDTIGEIKFRVSVNEKDFHTLNSIRQINFSVKDAVQIETTDGKSHQLHQRSVSGEIVPIKIGSNSKGFEELTIEHTPSIYAVLFANYLNKSEDFKILSSFAQKWKKHEGKQKLYSSDLKAYSSVSHFAEVQPNYKQIKKSYENIFSKIKLEIVHRSVNGPNISLQSLQFLKENISSHL